MPAPFGAGIGPRHMVFNFGNDIYVLPGGVNLVVKGPPQITAATPNADGTVTGLDISNDLIARCRARNPPEWLSYAAVNRSLYQILVQGRCCRRLLVWRLGLSALPPPLPLRSGRIAKQMDS